MSATPQIFKEHTVVRLKEQYASENRILPKGTIGTIVDVYPEQRHYAVEFNFESALVLFLPHKILDIATPSGAQ